MAHQRELVFITGATGYIGSQVAAHTLNAGYSIRLSIRRKDQEASIRQWLPTSPTASVDFVHIPDFTAPGAFAKALEGVDYVFHLAAPLPGQGGDVREEYVKPVVEGTLNILRTAKQYGKIKLVAVTNSVAGLMDQGSWTTPPVVPKGQSQTERPWQIEHRLMSMTANIGECPKFDLDMEYPQGLVGDVLKYCAGKILANQAVRDFVHDEKPAFKVVSFFPCSVIGESLIQRSFSEMDPVNSMLWNSFASKEPVVPSAFVGVKQCAEAHLKAVQRLPSLQGGREYLLSSPSKGWKSVARYMRDEFPDVEVNLGPGPFPVFDQWVVDTKPAREELGLEWKEVNEIVRETVIQQLEFASKEKANSTL